MAMGATETVRRPFPTAGVEDGEDVSVGPPALVFLATGMDRPVDPMIWGDEKRMKRELVAWAKAVASIAASKNAPPPLAVAVHETQRRAVSIDKPVLVCWMVPAESE